MGKILASLREWLQRTKTLFRSGLQVLQEDNHFLTPFKGFSIRSSEVLSWAHCESSKPGRSTSREGPFPAASVAREEKCLWDKNKRLAICGDFCVSPNVEGAIASRIAAASKLTEILSSL